MSPRVPLAPVLLLVATSAVAVHAGDVIDRIVATVNSVAILQSDVDGAIRCEALLEGRALESITPEQQQATLQRLIDQELLRQQMEHAFPAPAPGQIAERIRQIRMQLPGAQSDETWHATLARYGLTEPELIERVTAQMQIAGFIESRLQPNVQVDAAGVQAYYQEKLLPELRKRGVQPAPPLDEVSGQIEQILREERMNETLTSWLRNLRQQSRIRTQPEPVPPAARQASSSRRSAAESTGK